MPVRKYATIGDYSRHIGSRAPDDFDQSKLLRASRRIDRVLIGAIYDVDDSGMPTDQLVVEALRDATCALAAWWDEIGETGTGASGNIAEYQIGNLRIRRGAGARGGAAATSQREISAEVLDILQTCVTSSGRPLLPSNPHVFG